MLTLDDFSVSKRERSAIIEACRSIPRKNEEMDPALRRDAVVSHTLSILDVAARYRTELARIMS